MKKKIKYKVISLFSGIGGFEEGLEHSKLKGEVIFSSEIDQFAKKSYLANYPNHNLHGDITKVDASEIPEHDILMGGFPCQAFSIAGKRQGFSDTRGTLFFDVACIVNEKKPEVILLENVKNLISHDKSNTIKTILNTLSELGYAVDFTVIDSSEFGVPQSRTRTYIIGMRNISNEKYEEDKRNKKVNALKQELNDIKDFNSFNFFNSLISNKKKLHIEDVMESNVDVKYYINNNRMQNFLNEVDIVATKKEVKIIKLFDLPKEVHNDQERQRRVYSVKGISPTVLARSDSTKILLRENDKYVIRKFTPVENLRIQGFSNEFIEKIKSTGISDTQLYKQSGNAVSPPVIKEIFNHIKEFLEMGSDDEV